MDDCVSYTQRKHSLQSATVHYWWISFSIWFFYNESNRVLSTNVRQLLHHSINLTSLLSPVIQNLLIANHNYKELGQNRSSTKVT